MIQIVVITTFIKMCFSHTYIGQADFVGITQANAKPIIFMNRQPTAAISINITDDNLVEGREHFLVHIISGGNVSNLTIFAPNTTVNIEDNDGEYHYCINNIIFLLSMLQAEMLAMVVSKNTGSLSLTVGDVHAVDELFVMVDNIKFQDKTIIHIMKLTLYS